MPSPQDPNKDKDKATRQAGSSFPVQPNKPRNILLGEGIDAILEWFKDLLDLETGLDREGTIIYIRNSKRMRANNAWLLICSIFVASIGLDQNSDAVIIGGMLISPLMAPILGLGLSVGTNDKEALFISLRHFGIAVLIAVVTSTLYFSITPLGSLTEAIASRTKPTILDCLVAIFGGLAGIISISRKEKGSAIPGVAIATALMPPLCVTGYGIAKGDATIALNSFYLFFLNSFFIALTTYLMVRYLRFPYKRFMDPAEALRARWVTAFFTVLLVMPSVIILANVWQERTEIRKLESFVQEYFGPESNTHSLGYRIVETDSTRKLLLELIGERIPQDSTDYLYAGLQKHGLEDLELSLFQNPQVGLDQLAQMELEITNLEQMATNLEAVESARDAQERQIQDLKTQLEKGKRDSLAFVRYSEELKILFPNIDRMGFARSLERDRENKALIIPTFLVHWDQDISTYTRRREEAKLLEYLKLRIGLDTLQLVNY